MIYLSLSELEALLTSLREYAEKYRTNRPVLEALEERWLKFQELAFAFGVELKPAEGVEFYAGGPLPDNLDFIKKIDRLLATVRRLREVYGDVKVMVDLDISIKKTVIKI
ncbi:hypothetical protein [Pyrobaculum aerophilum]|uniref:Uncharacterized protein n=2 Tax=Pyrobaculum aerophilum TaxID=13773 RepID=Q8ZU38_PYRAE|nr:MULTISPECIES: hypothetical protein [Pyrobaculum]AAL64570.1 hypothetical protein PAE2964 [Pyrobaculum aerophilum str. IM2]MCX8136037.1 hypothetical protein [Pyrobaculum aerophilum]RFA93478.1 hypothetical protein CGL51_12910 [Pyrobaculum aerophilum]RFB00337.1 hypothetical protein CGL52_00270 [Pyrobaculum aerophilum]HII47414.1 hypothetical protein [Pyrobaculum aerophilum]